MKIVNLIIYALMSLFMVATLILSITLGVVLNHDHEEPVMYEYGLVYTMYKSGGDFNGGSIGPHKKGETTVELIEDFNLGDYNNLDDNPHLRGTPVMYDEYTWTYIYEVK